MLVRILVKDRVFLVPSGVWFLESDTGDAGQSQPHRRPATWWERLPTVVGSGEWHRYRDITSWSTRGVVQGKWGQVGPLAIEKMGTAMGNGVGYTYQGSGLILRRGVGNAGNICVVF